MRTLKIFLIVALFSGRAWACGCDIDCPEGEYYSDEAEMCVAETDAVS